MAETLTKEEAIFHAALEIGAAGQRSAYLNGACENQEELRQRVEALLRRYAEAEGPLDRPAISVAATTDERVAERPGTVIGPYKLLEQIGEGGMGLVFMADQSRPVRRRVALKVLKPGMDSRQVVARFEAERQALAVMDHPHIAKVFDAGTTESGRPYFVMELVKGVPITEFCDQHRLTTRQRLELFATVCQAVQHAHQKGIIHRDLKPSNVLVTLHDTVAVPKVIDFGIAKATTGPLTERTLFTHFAQMVGTPLYMSPEQAEMNGLDVDTRSDVYSLGVLLYELLTGTTPFESDTLKKAGLDEMRRIIREDEPPRPSHRVSTLGAEACSTVHEQRGVDGRRLSDLLRGELDWIVMKALEKDRNRRYESASMLAADVQRYLNDEPVEACPPSKVYRLRKFARRNRRTLVTAGVITLALVAATLVSVWQAVLARDAQHQAEAAERQAKTDRDRAREAEQHATTKAAIATEVSNFLQHDLLRLLHPEVQLEEGFQVNPNLTVRETLDRAAVRIDKRFRDQPLVEAEIRLTIGNAYANIGEPRAAITHFSRAVELRKVHLGREHEDTLRCVLILAQAYADAGQIEEALALHAEWMDQFKTTFGIKNRAALTYLHPLARVSYMAGKFEDAERWRLAELEILRKTDRPNSRSNTMFALNWLTRINLRQKKYVAAEAAVRESLTILDEDALDQAGQRVPTGSLAWVRYTHMSLLGGALLGQEQYSDAEPLLLKGYEGLSKWEIPLGPLPRSWRLIEAVELIVWFYEATNQPEKARTWREKLSTEKSPADTRP